MHFRRATCTRGNLHPTQNPSRKTPATLRCLKPHRKSLCSRRCGRECRLQRSQRQVVDCRRLASDAVVVHRIDAVGGNVNLEKVAISFTKSMHAFHGDAAKRQVVGKLPVRGGKGGQIRAEPPCKNLTWCTLSSLNVEPSSPYQDHREGVSSSIPVGNPSMLRSFFRCQYSSRPFSPFASAHRVSWSRSLT